MSQTRDMISVTKMIDFLLRDALAVGTEITKAVDLRAAIANSDLTEVVTRVLLGIAVEFGATGTIDISIQHRDDGGTWVTLGALSQMNATDGANFYIGEVYDLKQWIRFSIVVTGVVQTIAIIGAGGHGTREPVVQDNTELTFTKA